MLLSRWKMVAGVLGVSLGGLATVAGQCPKSDADKGSKPIEVAIATQVPAGPTIPDAAPTIPVSPARPTPPTDLLPPVPGPVPAAPAPMIEPPAANMVPPTLPAPVGVPAVATAPATPPVPAPAPSKAKPQLPPEKGPVIPASGTAPQAAPAAPSADPLASGPAIPPSSIEVAKPTTPTTPSSPPIEPPTTGKPQGVLPGKPLPNPVAEQQIPPPPPSAAAPSTAVIDAAPAPDKPSVVSAPIATNSTRFRIVLRVGEGEPSFEVRSGDDLVLKVVCEKVDIKSPEKGHGYSAVKASGKVRFAGFGAEGSCDDLAFLAGTGEVTMTGNVKVQVKDKLGRVESELSTDKEIKYRIDAAAIGTLPRP
jgi:hypothetical protein